MMTDGGLIDGSWELQILVTDMQVERTLRVKGDLHIGGVMLKLVESLEFAVDWSDHALWWPEENMWLSRTRSTLDQYGVSAEARLHFTPMHKNLKLQLPDLQIMDVRADFSVKIFASVIQICKEMGIRHPEEVSLWRKVDRDELRNRNNVQKRRRQPDSPSGTLSPGGGGTSPYLTINSNHSGDSGQGGLFPRTPQGTLLRPGGSTPGSPFTPHTPASPYSYNGTLSPGSMSSLSFEGSLETSLINSPQTPSREAFNHLYRPKSYADKAKMNAWWLDSSRSLMEQNIRENDTVLLKFKFYSFYDLNPKYDAVRINQIYEQGKWALISEEIDCTEEEMMMFAALQLQVSLRANTDQPDGDQSNSTNEEGDDIDAALTDLQVSLEGSHITSPGDITRIPELQDYLKFFKPKKLTFKSFKKYWFAFRDTHLVMHKSKETTNGQPLMRVNLKGCEVQPDINITSQKYGIKLFIPGPDGMQEVWIRCETEDQYAKWMAAFKLASKGKTMADSTYETEVQSIQAFLSMQRPAPAPAVNPNQLDINPEDYVAPRFFKKFKTKQLVQRIVDSHANVRDMTLTEAKLNFIKAWQALPEFGITYFLVKFRNNRKEELVGIAHNRIMKMDLSNGDCLKTWRYSTMKAWNVNWEVREVLVQFEEEEVAFKSPYADCKIIHEFIGGYIFLSMRSSDKNQTLDQEMFFKLTGGWS
ncbi:fermitin family homolog 2 [Lingula anatina]|uniref:Fermitin family homolog 2 n=1 Tax=Lingula anatina TaxID=7574 RepID=A0A1S3J2D1_LINAN|nr:fermitin family homolog 2 [Lingula anatina]|eukprot:XP_013404560.1 fermitin family homolog 2 [Lingula anatina]